MESKGLPSVEVLDSPATGMLVIRGGALRGAVYLVGILLSLLSVPLMTRYLGAVDYGRVVTVAALVTIVAAITDGGLTTVGVREYAVWPAGGHRALMRAALGLRLTLTIAGVTGALVFAAAVGYESVLVLGTFIAGLGLLVGAVQRTLTIPLVTSLRLGTVAGVHLLEQTALVAFVVLLVLAGAALEPFFAAYLVSGLAALTAVVAVSGWRVPLPTVDLATWRLLLRDMLPYGAATAISPTGVLLIAMPLLTTDLQVGYFGIAAQIVTVLLGVWMVVSGSITPVLSRAARDDRERLRRVLGRTLHAAVVTGAGMGVLTLVGASLAVRVLGGPKFEPAASVLQLLAPTLVVAYIVAVCSLALVSMRRPGWVLGVNACVLVLTVTLALLLVPSHGAEGAAIAVLAGQGLSLAGFAVALQRNGLGGPEPTRLAGLVVAAAAVAVAAGVLLPVPDVVATAVAALLYAGVLVLLRAVPREFTDLFRPTPPAEHGRP